MSRQSKITAFGACAAVFATALSAGAQVQDYRAGERQPMLPPQTQGYRVQPGGNRAPGADSNLLTLPTLAAERLAPESLGHVDLNRTQSGPRAARPTEMRDNGQPPIPVLPARDIVSQPPVEPVSLALPQMVEPLPVLYSPLMTIIQQQAPVSTTAAMPFGPLPRTTLRHPSLQYMTAPLESLALARLDYGGGAKVLEYGAIPGDTLKVFLPSSVAPWVTQPATTTPGATETPAYRSTVDSSAYLAAFGISGLSAASVLNSTVPEANPNYIRNLGNSGINNLTNPNIPGVQFPRQP